jgi:hypothetical protein
VSDITDLYVGKYGVPRAGSRVFIQTLQVIDGWDDLPKQISAIVPATWAILRPSGHGQVGY